MSDAPGAVLDAAELFILDGVTEEAAALWELADLRITDYLCDETRLVGPGWHLDTREERLCEAQRAARSLLVRGLVDVYTGPDWLEEGERLSGAAAANALADRSNWAWPLEIERERFVWLAPTPLGVEVLERTPPDRGIPAPSRKQRIARRLAGLRALVRGMRVLRRG